MGEVKVAGIDTGTKPEVYESSAERATQSGNPNGDAADRENEVDMPALKAQHMEAALSAKNAEDTKTSAETALERQRSDPRFDNDQKILKMAQEGKLQAAQSSDPSGLVASGMVSPEVAETLPKTTEEQVEKDAEKLDKIEDSASATKEGDKPSNPNVTGGVTLASDSKDGGTIS